MSDHVIHAFVRPIVSSTSDFVVGSRVLDRRVRKALTPQQIAGNWLATRYIRLIWGARFTDLGPFRAIRRAALNRLNMSDRTFGWTVQLQIRPPKPVSAFRKFRCATGAG